MKNGWPEGRKLLSGWRQSSSMKRKPNCGWPSSCGASKMARQEELFPKPEHTISIHDSRRDSALWVRRLVLWAQPGEVIRDVRLRRGLNVIWSPDPGSAVANVG